MVDEIKDWDEQLSDTTTEIKRGIESLSSLKGSAKDAKANDIQGRINRAKELYQQYKVALRELSKGEAIPWEKKSKEYNNTITQLITDLNFARSEGDREQLMGGKKDLDTMTSQQIVQAASNIQDSSISALERANKKIQETAQIGTAINMELEAQNRQLVEIKNGIDTVQDNLKQADRQIRAFMRRVMTDKLIMVLLFLVICGVIGAIVAGVLGKSNGAVNSKISNNNFSTS